MPERTYKASDLVGAHEIGARLHVEARSVHSWVHRYSDFPPPIAKLHGAWVWAWPDVEAWAKVTGRK